jgi:hypothetical protein
MRTRAKTQAINVTVTVIDAISIDAREAAFLRSMALFCIEKRMPGCHACKLLDGVLRDAGIPEYDGEPVYGLFEVAP